jgi:hypothetical protein
MDETTSLKKQYVALSQTIKAKTRRQENNMFETVKLNEVKVKLFNMGLRPMVMAYKIHWYKESEV